MFRAIRIGAVTLLAGAAGCLGAASAGADPGTLTTTSGGPVHLHGSQSGTLVLELTDNSNLKTTCTTAGFTTTEGSSTADGSSSFTVQPIFSGCTAFGLNSTINTGSCHYLVGFGETTGTGEEFDADLDIECGTGAITITTLTCELKIDSQSGLGGLTVDNSGSVGSGMDLTLETNVSNISYTVLKDGFGCPLAGVGSYTKGDLTGKTTVSGSDPSTGGAVGVTLDHTDTPARGTLATATGEAVRLHGDQVGSLELVLTDNSNLRTTCVTAGFTSTEGDAASDGESSLTVQPIFSGGCTAFGLNATIDTGSCHYLIRSGETVGEIGAFEASLDIGCGASGITITTLTCEMMIGSQSGLTGLTVTNSGGSGSPMDLLVDTELSGISYTVLKDGIGCPLTKVGSFDKADLSGQTTVSGTDPSSGKPVGVTLDHRDSPPRGTLATTSGGPVHLHGSQSGTLVLELTDNSNLKTTCTTAGFTTTEGSSTANGSFAFTVQPIFAGCTAFGLPSSINTGSCHYLVESGETAGETGEFAATWDIQCGAGAITLTTLTCELKIDSQAGHGGLTAANSGESGTGMDLILDTDVKGIPYTVIKDGIGCPLSKTGDFSEADFRGETTVSGFDPSSGEPVGVTLDHAA